MSAELEIKSQESRGTVGNRRLMCRRHGAAAVEFACAAPILALLIFGCIEYGQLIDASQTVSNASRRGARMAARYATGSTLDVDAYVRSFLAESYPQLGSSSSAVTVSVKDASGGTISGSNLGQINSGSQLSVDVSLPFAAVRWLGIFSTLNNSTLQTSTIARRQ